MTLTTELKNYLNVLWKNHSLDIRKTENGRWYDQKVTPDVMSAICDVIKIESRRSEIFYPFKIRTIWNCESFENQISECFNKPHPQNPKTKSEYDKFIAQPLNVLSAAGILIKERLADGNVFNPASENAKLLIAEMADSEMITCEFLYYYIMESLRQSKIDGIFNAFLKKPDIHSLQSLKEGYAAFIIEHTNINKEIECNRVFSKVLNICAFTRKVKGVRQGHLSQTRITLTDIRYNRTNLRDDAIKKPKDIPRQLWRFSPSHPFRAAEISQGYNIQKVVKDVKRHHNNQPEILDSYSGTGLSSKITVEGHHIFPKSQYPNFADKRENIILLTPTQHTSHAHGGTGVCSIDLIYQCYCLLEKLKSIEKCKEDKNCNFYSFDEFKNMLTHLGILCKSTIYNIADVQLAIMKFYGKPQ